jgi:hypothetical protein
MLEIVNDHKVSKGAVDEDGLGGPVLDFAQLRGTFVGFRNTAMGFDKNKFCDEHREWAFLKPYLEDRPQQPWTTFGTTKSEKKTKSETRSSLRINGKNKTKRLRKPR